MSSRCDQKSKTFLVQLQDSDPTRPTVQTLQRIMAYCRLQQQAIEIFAAEEEDGTLSEGVSS